MTEEEFERWVAIDDDHLIAVEQSEEEQSEAALQEIISDIKNAGAVNDGEDDYEEDLDEELPTPTNSEMRNALEVLRRGLERRGYPEIDKFDFMGEGIRDFLRKQPNSQLTIEQCFK